MSEIEDPFDMYAKILMKGFCPDFMQVTLGDLRSWSAEPLRQQVVDFLKATETVPGAAIVNLSRESISLLVDDNDCLLEFA